MISRKAKAVPADFIIKTRSAAETREISYSRKTFSFRKYGKNAPSHLLCGSAQGLRRVVEVVDATTRHTHFIPCWDASIRTPFRLSIRYRYRPACAKDDGFKTTAISGKWPASHPVPRIWARLPRVKPAAKRDGRRRVWRPPRLTPDDRYSKHKNARTIFWRAIVQPAQGRKRFLSRRGQPLPSKRPPAQ
jgi:hypothetical protein